MYYNSTHKPNATQPKGKSVQFCSDCFCAVVFWSRFYCILAWVSVSTHLPTPYGIVMPSVFWHDKEWQFWHESTDRLAFKVSLVLNDIVLIVCFIIPYYFIINFCLYPLFPILTNSVDLFLMPYTVSSCSGVESGVKVSWNGLLWSTGKINQ